MKITVVCAGGKEGRLLVKEARDRGHEVTAVVRSSASAPKADKVLVKDLFQLTRGDVRGSDAVIDAFGAWTEETLPQHSTSLKHLGDIVSDTDIDVYKRQGLWWAGGGADGNCGASAGRNGSVGQRKEY